MAKKNQLTKSGNKALTKRTRVIKKGKTLGYRSTLVRQRILFSKNADIVSHLQEEVEEVKMSEVVMQEYSMDMMLAELKSRDIEMRNVEQEEEKKG